MTATQIIIAVVVFLVGMLFILAIVGGKRCPECDRHVDGDCDFCKGEKQ